MQSTKRRSLHFQLLKIVAFALALAIIISGISIILFGKSSLERSNHENLNVIAQILADKTAFPLSLGSDYAEEAEQTLASARYHTDLSKVCLYDAKGNLFGQYLVATSVSRCYSSLTTNTADININARNLGISERVTLPVIFGEEPVGHIVIESTGQRLKSLLSAMTLAIFGSLLVALVFGFLFGSKLVRDALAGLRELSKTGLSIAKNPFSVERARKTQNDEVGDLVDTFNGMLDALNEENHKLKTSENTFRTLSENAPVGVFLRSPTSDYEFINSTWSAMTGLKIDDAQSFTDNIGTEFKRSYIEKIASLNKGAKFVVTEFEYIHKKDKDPRYLQEYVSVVNEGDTTLFIGTLIDITELKHSQIELKKLAYYDPLTKLPNRRYLNDHLSYTFAAAEKKHEKIAVFMMDLDNFKRINDTLGHDAGDQLLECIARRLKNSVFKEDVVVRMGGDEFVVLVNDIENLNSIEFISKRLLNAMRTEAEHGLSTLPVTGSIGVAIYPDDSKSPEDLLRHADIALYQSKASSGDTFSCYSEALDRAIHEQVRIEQKLRHALDTHQLQVYLQPQVHANNKEFFWAEALVRWHDAEDGFITPDKFIPVAEETGLIIDVGKLVLELVCKILRDYELDLATINIKGISVNLSAKQFFSDSLLHDIQNTLKKYNVSPDKIEFELTESTVADNIERAVTIMERLRDLGCRLSIDDFGTGYSSLSYLSKFPITSLKIDRSFVDKVPGSKSDEEIARTIINLAHNIGVSVVAEGVETERQALYLHEQGCEYLQGYHFAKPAPIEQLLTNHVGEKTQKLDRKLS